MHIARRKAIIPLTCVVGLFLVSGCTDYKKKYDYLNVEHQNTLGRYENLQATNQQLSDQVAKDQELINNLQKQIQDAKKTPDVVTGFEGENVKFDPLAGTITVTVENAILFDSGKAALKSATSQKLDHIISVVKQKYAGRLVDVVGNTDTDPINKTKDQWKDNWELSAQRSLAVVRYMASHGIPDDQVRSVACGSTRPVAPNTTTADKAKNRRVEIVVHLRQQQKAA